MERVNVHLCLGAGTKPFSFVAEFESKEDALLVVEFLQKAVKENGGFEAIGSNKAQFDFPDCVGISFDVSDKEFGIQNNSKPMQPCTGDPILWAIDGMLETEDPNMSLKDKREREAIFRAMMYT